MIFRVVAGAAGVAKFGSGFLTFRAGAMKLGPESGKLRGALLISGFLFAADGIYFIMLALGAPAIVTTLWLMIIAAAACILFGWLLARRVTHREALYSGSENES